MTWDEKLVLVLAGCGIAAIIVIGVLLAVGWRA
jgi:hypothetical protein